MPRGQWQMKELRGSLMGIYIQPYKQRMTRAYRTLQQKRQMSRSSKCMMTRGGDREADDQHG